MKKILFALAAVVMLAPACTQDLTDGQNSVNVPMKKVTFGVTFEQPEFVDENGTRISLNDENQIVWEEGDKVNIVYTPTGGTITFTTAEVDGGFVGVPVDEPIMLEFSLPADGKYTVHYAYSSKCTHDQLTAEKLRPRFSVVGGDTGASANNCAAYPELENVIRDCFATGSVDVAEQTITLRNSAAFFEVQLTGNGEEVWSVDVLSKSQNLRSMYATVTNPASENPTFTIYQGVERKKEDPSAMGGAHYVTSTAKKLSSTPTSYYFAMPVGTFPAGDLFIQIRTNLYTRLYRATQAHSFKRNHVTVLKPIPVKPVDTDAHTYQPLDAEGRSNCYMVAPSNEDKYYSFSIKNVNGSTLIFNGKTKNYGVWPMWATKDGLVEDISVIYGEGTGAEGRVYFRVPAGTGNGSCMLTGGPLNAALIGTNWAWHIWITDAHAITYGEPEITVLDRSIGATWTPTSKEEVVAMTGETAAQTVGFMYQYGRHNAFPGPKSLNNPSGANLYGYEGPGGSSSKGRFETNTPNVVFYKFARWQNGFTCYDHDNKDASGARYYNMQMLFCEGTWATDVTQASINADGLSGNKNFWSTTEKGNQDPCPQGYRVAGITELERMFRELKADGSLSLYANHYSPSNKTYSITAQKTVDTNGDGTIDSKDSYDAANAALKYATDVLGTFSNGEVGESTKAKREAALNGNFIWFPHGGFRMMHNDKDKDEHGCLLYSTNYLASGNTLYTPSVGVIWGVPDFDLTNLKQTTKTAMPNHAITGYNNYVLIPFKWATTGENIWTYTTLATSDITVRFNTGKTAFTMNKGGLPAHDAAPVRCVKMASASGEAQVSSLAAKQADANAWN